MHQSIYTITLSITRPKALTMSTEARSKQSISSNTEKKPIKMKLKKGYNEEWKIISFSQVPEERTPLKGRTNIHLKQKK